MSGEGLHGQSSVLRVSMNLLSVAAGAGVLGFPFAVKEAGIATFIVMSLSTVVLIQYTVNLLVKCGVSEGILYYEQLVAKLYGQTGYIAFLMIYLLYDFGAILTYLVLIGDLSVGIFTGMRRGNDKVSDPEYLALEVRRVGILIVTVLIILPLCSMRDMSKLERFSLLSILTTMLMLGVCTYFLITTMEAEHTSTNPEPNANGQVDYVYTVGENPYTAFGILCFTFVFHDSSFLLLHTLQKPTEARWKRVSRGTLLCALILSSSIGFIGYFTFGKDTQQDILRNYGQTASSSSSIPILGIRILFLLALALKYPIPFFVARHVLNRLLNLLRIVYSSEDIKEIDNTLFVVLTVIILGSSVGVSLMVVQPGIAMSLTGNVCAVTLAFIFPALCSIKSIYMHQRRIAKGEALNDEKNKLIKFAKQEEFGTFSSGKVMNNGGQWKARLRKSWSSIEEESLVEAWILLGFGIIAALVCSYQTLQGAL